MKYLVFFLLISTISYSQEIEDILNTKKFVLKATKITDDEGKSYTSISKLSFIMIDSTEIIVQWVSDFDNNGLGGITIGGNITNYEHTYQEIDNETQHVISINCEMDRGRVKSNLVFEIYSKSHADANLKNASSSIFVPEEMKFLGRIIPIESAKVVIGAH
jgi:hypothetical protein